MKKVLLILTILLFLTPAQTGANTSTTTTYTQQQMKPVSYNNCVKTYQIHSSELFQRLLSAISSSNYQIIELQSKTSKVLFSAWGREFMATVVRKTSNSATVKILPTDNSFYFKQEITDRIFNEIDANKMINLTKVNKQ